MASAKSSPNTYPAGEFMNLLKKLFSPSTEGRTAHDLYVAAVARARSPVLYDAGGAPDSIDGRFDLIVLHVHLVVERLRREADGSRARQVESALVEVFFDDMDRSLREMGVGDLGVSKRMHDMAGAFFGRVEAYNQALQALDEGVGRAALEAVLQRNVYANEGEETAVRYVADHIIRWRAALGEAAVDSILAGRLPVI